MVRLIVGLFKQESLSRQSAPESKQRLVIVVVMAGSAVRLMAVDGYLIRGHSSEGGMAHGHSGGLGKAGTYITVWP
jgi:hypothetical protein